MHRLCLFDTFQNIGSQKTLVSSPGEPGVSVDVHDGHELGESYEGEARGAEAVEQCEPVLARPRGEHQPDREAAHSHAANQYRLLHMLQTENCTFNLLLIR